VPRYRVRVVASYATEETPAEARGGHLIDDPDDDQRIPPQLHRKLVNWASKGADDSLAEVARSYETDHEIAPVRGTATALYELDADSPEDAERAALERFASSSADAGLSRPETILPHSEET
jgi:hypothetical protein